MKRTMVGLVALFFACIMLMTSCETNGWQGFDEEDLSLYLTLGPYKGLPYTVFDTVATDGEVENAIRLRLEAATELTATEEPIAEGTTVTFDRFSSLTGFPPHRCRRRAVPIGAAPPTRTPWSPPFLSK